MCLPKTGYGGSRIGGTSDRERGTPPEGARAVKPGVGSLKDGGKGMSGKVREAVFVGGILGLLAVGIVFF